MKSSWKLCEDQTVTMYLRPGDLISYVPGDSENSQQMGATEDIPYGTTGVFLGLGSGWEKFVAGCEPVDVLINGRVIRLYMDEVKKVEDH